MSLKYFYSFLLFHTEQLLNKLICPYLIQTSKTLVTLVYLKQVVILHAFQHAYSGTTAILFCYLKNL